MYLDSDFPLEIPEVPQSLETCEDINAWLLEKIEGLVRSINSQHAEKASLRSRYDRMSEWYNHDIEAIGDALLNEAAYRGWCSEFDTFVADLNQKLHTELKTRMKEFNVTAVYKVTISQSITAVDEDDAINIFRENEGLASQRWSVSDFDDWDEEDIEADEYVR